MRVSGGVRVYLGGCPVGERGVLWGSNRVLGGYECWEEGGVVSVLLGGGGADPSLPPWWGSGADPCLGGPHNPSVPPQPLCAPPAAQQAREELEEAERALKEAEESIR